MLIFNNTEYHYYCVIIIIIIIIIILLLLSEDKGRFTIAIRLQSMFGTAIPGVLLSYYPNNYLRHYHPYAELIYNTTQRGNTVHIISQSEPAPTRALPMQDGCCGTGKHIFSVFLFHS